jgi:hypothetical protein
LPSGTRWYFNVTGQTSVSSTTTTASINLVNGTYSYLVAPSIKTYATYPVHGTFTVAGSAIALSGTFSAVSFIIAFTETGLPVHTKWFVNVTGQSSVSSTTTTLNVSVVNGTYTYGIAAANGYTPSPLSGILSISGAGTAIPVTFSVTVLTFHAVGSLPSSWTVRLNSSFTNVSKTATGSAYVNFTTPAGVTYFYAIVVASPYTATPQNGIVVLVASATVNITMHRGSAPATFSLTFNEAGLAAGVVWSVTVNGTGLNTVQTSSASSQTFVGLVSGGSYAYAVSAATYTATPSSGTVLANANQTVSITFVTVYYPVTFNPHGLGVNSWTVTLNGVAKTASGQIVFSEPLGFYTYTVSAPSGYSASPSSGTVHVTSSAGVTTTVTLAALTPYVLSFSESGLTAGASWTVVVNGVSLTGTSSTQGMSVANGTYSYVVSATSGQLPSPSSGSVAVLGASASIAITFPSIMLRFNATGLASGTSWTVTVNGQAQTGTGNLTWYVSPGSYTYVITAPSGYAATMWSGTVSVVSSSVTVSVAFTPAATYVLAFHETGLSPSTPWSVTVNGVVWPGTGSTISASVPAGTYSYRVGSIAGFRATPSSGAVAVGSSVTIGISFLPIGASLPLTYPTVVLAAVRTR